MTITPMTKEAAQEWIDALPKYKKGKGVLCDANGSMCCLGVLAKMHGDLSDEPEYIEDQELDCFYFKDHPKASQKEVFPPLGYCGLSVDAMHVLSRVNDESDTFAPVIAEIKRMFIDGAET